MKIFDRQRRNLLQIWKSQQRRIRAEFSAGNIAVWFTGYVSSYSEIEFRLSRDNDEISISLFLASYRVIELEDAQGENGLAGYRRVVIVSTDAHTACTLYELCD